MKCERCGKKLNLLDMDAGTKEHVQNRCQACIKAKERKQKLEHLEVGKSQYTHISGSTYQSFAGWLDCDRECMPDAIHIDGFKGCFFVTVAHSYETIYQHQYSDARLVVND